MSIQKPRPSLSGGGKPVHARRQHVVESLHTKYEQLNSLLEQAEAGLRQIPVPVDVYFTYLSEDMFADQPGFQAHSHLGFVRTGGGWRICCAYHDDTDIPTDCLSWRPVAECGVKVRVEIIPHLGRLRDEVLKAAEDFMPSLDKSIDALRDTLAAW